jgi:hypothetical protein
LAALELACITAVASVSNNSWKLVLMDMHCREDRVLLPECGFAWAFWLTGLLALLASCGGGGGAVGGPPASNVALRIPDTGNPTGDAGTILLEVNPSWSGSDPSTVPLLMVGSPGQSDNRLEVVKDGSNLRVVSSTSAGEEGTIGVSVADWMPGDAHHVSVTWGDGVENVYLDGQLIGQSYYDGALEIPPGTPVSLALDSPDSPLQVFGRPLTPDEVENLFEPPTPVGPGVSNTVMRLRSTSVAAPETTGTVCVELVGGTGMVAGTQNDLSWDSRCVQISEPCQANPRTNKGVVTRKANSGLLRALVFSFTDVGPIEDGTLYCCPFRLLSATAGSCCGVDVQRALGSDFGGGAVWASGEGGQICQR